MPCSTGCQPASFLKALISLSSLEMARCLLNSPLQLSEYAHVRRPQLMVLPACAITFTYFFLNVSECFLNVSECFWMFLKSNTQSNPFRVSTNAVFSDFGIAWSLGQLCISSPNLMHWFELILKSDPKPLYLQCYAPQTQILTPFSKQCTELGCQLCHHACLLKAPSQPVQTTLLNVHVHALIKHMSSPRVRYTLSWVAPCFGNVHVNRVESCAECPACSTLLTSTNHVRSLIVTLPYIWVVLQDLKAKLVTNG